MQCLVLNDVLPRVSAFGYAGHLINRLDSLSRPSLHYAAEV